MILAKSSTIGVAFWLTLWVGILIGGVFVTVVGK